MDTIEFKTGMIMRYTRYDNENSTVIRSTGVFDCFMFSEEKGSMLRFTDLKGNQFSFPSSSLRGVEILDMEV